MKNLFKAIFVILGTIVGAGFATGQEIYLFFGKYGVLGKAALVLSGIIFGLLIFKTFSFIQKNEIDSYGVFVEKVFKKRKSFLTNTISIIVVLFLGVCFIIMCSGMGAYFNQELKIPNWVGATIMCIVASGIVVSKNNGIVKLNEVAMPFLIIIILIISFASKR